MTDVENFFLWYTIGMGLLTTLVLGVSILIPSADKGAAVLRWAAIGSVATMVGCVATLITLGVG